MLDVYQLQLGKLDNYNYIIADSKTKKAAITDPAWEIDKVKQFLVDKQLELTTILLTHSHFDHIQGIADLIDNNTTVYMSQAEFNLGAKPLENIKPTFVSDLQTIPLGSQTITCHFTPGHTVGGVCYQINDHLFTGDTLFINGCGRCDFKESDIQQMYPSLQKIKKLADTTIIWPGHNYGNKPSDTLGQQKKTNPFLQITDQDFFIDYRMNIHATYRQIPFSDNAQHDLDDLYQKWKTKLIK